FPRLAALAFIKRPDFKAGAPPLLANGGALELHEIMQRNRSKRYRAAVGQIDRTKAYNLSEAVLALKKMSTTKFDQTVTVSFRLGVDPKQSDQMVRGTCPLPHGSGKQVRV